MKLPRIAVLPLMSVTSYAVQAGAISFLARPVSTVDIWPPKFTGGPFSFAFSAMVLATLPRFFVGFEQVLLANYDHIPLVTLNGFEYGGLAFLDTVSLALLFLAAFNPNLMLDSLLILSFTEITLGRILSRKSLGRTFSINDLVLSILLVVLPFGYTCISVTSKQSSFDGVISTSAFAMDRIVPLLMVVVSRALATTRAVLFKWMLTARVLPEDNAIIEDDLNTFVLDAGLTPVSEGQRRCWNLMRLVNTPAYELSTASPTMPGTMKMYFLGSTLLATPAAAGLAYYFEEYPKSWMAIETGEIINLRSIVGLGTIAGCLCLNPVFEALAIRGGTPGQYMLAHRIPLVLAVPAAVIGLDRVTNFTLAQLVCLFGVAMASTALHHLGHAGLQRRHEKRAEALIEKRLGRNFDKLLFQRLCKSAPSDPTGDYHRMLSLEAAVYDGDLKRWYEPPCLRAWWEERKDEKE